MLKQSSYTPIAKLRKDHAAECMSSASAGTSSATEACNTSAAAIIASSAEARASSKTSAATDIATTSPTTTNPTTTSPTTTNPTTTCPTTTNPTTTSPTTTNPTTTSPTPTTRWICEKKKYTNQEQTELAKSLSRSKNGRFFPRERLVASPGENRPGKQTCNTYCLRIYKY